MFEDDGSMKAVDNFKLIDELDEKVKKTFDSTTINNTCLILRVLNMSTKIKFKNIKTFKEFRDLFIDLLLVEIRSHKNWKRIDLLFESFTQELPTSSKV